MSRVLTEHFGARVRENGSCVAVVDGADRLTYAELDAASDAVAAGLQARGAGPGHRVAVLLPRSADLVIAALGVLKCGAAYSPLDRNWPRERIDAVVGLLSASVVIDEEVFGELRRFRSERADVATTEDDPAVVLFTSGSTGAPKGVLCPHRAIGRLFPRAGYFDLTTPVTMPLAAAVPWDVLSLELWGTVCTGGTLVVVRDAFLTPARLRALVADHGVDSLVLATSVFALNVEEDVAAFAGLRQVLAGGEQLTTGHATAFRHAHAGTALINGYGPAENGIMSSSHLLTDDDAARERVPIGVPAPGTAMHLRDGEILVSGDGLALGYVGNPAETARRFIDLRLGAETVRAYRTGDRGHHDEDGLYYYDGRVDRQLKVRGHRIEPGEVEHVAGLVEGVTRASVVAVPSADDRPTALAIFYTGTVSGQLLRDRLAQSLPGYLVPDLAVAVPRLPLTSNGKIDHRALALRAAHEAVAREAAVVYSTSDGPAIDAGHGPAPAPAPRDATDGATQHAIAAVFADVLGRAVVPREDSFFALGGTSLTAGRLASRLTRVLAVRVPLDVVFGHPSVAELAAWAARRASEQHATEGPARRGAARPDGRVRLSHAQVPFLVAHTMDPADLSPLCPVVWDVDGEIEVPALHNALADVAQRHEALRSRYEMLDEPVAQVAAPPPIELARVSGAADVLPPLLVPLDITAGQVWRAALAPGRFGVVVHHIAFDGESATVLADDLSTAYTARVDGRAPVFAAPAPRLADIAGARPKASPQRLAVQREFWRHALADVPPLRLPHGDGDAGRLRSTCRAVDAAALAAAVRRDGTTETIAVLAAYAEAVGSLTGVGDLVVGVPVARRDDPAAARGIGCTMTVACVRLRGPGVAPARRALLDALHHGDVPVHEIARLARRRPLYEAVVSVQDNPEPQLRFPGVIASHVWVDTADLDTALLVELLPHGCLRVGWRADLVATGVGEALADAVSEALARLSHCVVEVEA